MAMDVLPGNHKVLAMIKDHWPGARTGYSREYDTICVQLQPRILMESQGLCWCGAPWLLVLGSADESVPVHDCPLQRACADDHVVVIW